MPELGLAAQSERRQLKIHLKKRTLHVELLPLVLAWLSEHRARLNKMLYGLSS